MSPATLHSCHLPTYIFFYLTRIHILPFARVSNDGCEHGDRWISQVSFPIPTHTLPIPISTLHVRPGRAISIQRSRLGRGLAWTGQGKASARKRVALPTSRQYRNGV